MNARIESPPAVLRSASLRKEAQHASAGSLLASSATLPATTNALTSLPIAPLIAGM